MVKVKQTRIYDKDGFRKRAACLCVRDPQESEILLVTSSRSDSQWIVPGGGVEPNENVRAAAIRETEEEAGVKGSIIRFLGEFEVCDKRKEPKHKTSVFVLLVQEELSEWEDSKSRKRCWFPIKEALDLLAIYKPVQCSFMKAMVATNPMSTLSQADVDVIIESISATPSTTAMQYLEVKHYYPVADDDSDNGVGGVVGTSSTPTIQTIAYTVSGIYLSTDDSETNEEGGGSGGSIDGNNHCCCSNNNNNNSNNNIDISASANNNNTTSTTK